MILRAALLALLCGCAARTPVDRALEEGAAGLAARKVPQGLALRCAPPEAEVSLDGVLQGTCEDLAGRVLGLEDGFHRIEVRRQGFSTYVVEIAPGQTRAALEVTLSPSR